MNSKQREIQGKCIAFAVKIDALRKMMNKKHREYNKADQIDRSASAIGANYSEAVYAESEADYIHKLGIAQKEANETIYWLELLKETGYIDEKMYESLYGDANEIMNMLTASIVTARKRAKKGAVL